ncbi:MAG: hypothetical protein AB7F22_36660 [Reyranella sp.]|uniref:hypothetical protein n=1 Tax=Reyranella sp. TaxID=1929291 RepID=UPI003D0D250F
MSVTPTRQARAVQPDHDHLDELLDQALAESFPASDPVAIDFSAPRDRNAREKGEGR